MENSETDEEDGAIQSFERTEINLVNLENKKDGYNGSKDLVNNDDIGLFQYTPKWFQNTFLNVYGLLFFLCWASTIQVSFQSAIKLYTIFILLLISTLKDNASA